MLKSLILISLVIGAALAAHRGGTKWNLQIQYAGSSCEGEPLVVGAVQVEDCLLSATPTCVIDPKFTGTSNTNVCVDSLRNSITNKTLPSNYAAEIVYRSFDGNNCTNIQGVSYLYIYSLNKCTPAPNRQGDDWRFYDTCDANGLSSLRECTNTCGDTCKSRVTRNGTCYRTTNSDFNTVYSCNSFNQGVLDVVAKLVSPAAFVTPTLFVVILLLATMWW